MQLLVCEVVAQGYGTGEESQAGTCHESQSFGPWFYTLLWRPSGKMCVLRADDMGNGLCFLGQVSDSKAGTFVGYPAKRLALLELSGPVSASCDWVT